jgi:aspartyl-tRNA(Asn)/glutamyl-tRNA(Gln) amidotransferase subunit C
MASDLIDRDQVLHVAQLARLNLTEDELDLMTQQLGSILNYVSLLNEVDTSQVHATSQVGVEPMPLREDEVCESLDHDLVLNQGPLSGHDGFVVPSFLEQ